MANPLDYTVADDPAIDVIRVVVALTIGLLILALLRVLFGKNRPQHHGEVVTINIGVVAYLLALLPAALTLLQQVGKPALVWRLPLAFLADVVGWFYLRRRL